MRRPHPPLSSVAIAVHVLCPPYFSLTGVLTARVGDLEAALAATSPDDTSNPHHLHLHRPAATADVPVRTPRSAVSPSTSPTAAAPSSQETPPVAPAGPSAVKLSEYVARAGLGSHPLGAFVDSTATADAAAVAQPDSGRYRLILTPFCGPC